MAPHYVSAFPMTTNPCRITSIVSTVGLTFSDFFLFIPLLEDASSLSAQEMWVQFSKCTCAHTSALLAEGHSCAPSWTHSHLEPLAPTLPLPDIAIKGCIIHSRESISSHIYLDKLLGDFLSCLKLRTET